jgi:AmiR/NasT family two-component response regulator
MQNVLLETFRNRFDVDVVGVANGGLSAVRIIEKTQPDLVVIDSNLPASETKALILWIKEECQCVSSLVLAENTQQMREASNTGADMTLRTYSLPEGLEKVLGRIQSNQQKER